MNSVAQWEFEHVRLYPHEIGLIIGNESWSNETLHTMSRRFAGALVRLGVVPGDRVAIALPNSLALFISSAGATIAGAVLVVLNDQASAELTDKLAHCAPRVVVCTTSTGASIAEAGLDISAIILDGPARPGMLTFEDVVAHATSVIDPVRVAATDLAQLCYTSGSTGRPKAVPYTHGNLNRFLHSFAEGVCDRHVLTPVLVCAPPTAFGGRLLTLRVLANNQYIVHPTFEPERVLKEIGQHRISHLSLLPTMAEQLVACSARCRYNGASLRTINIGGAHVPAKLVAALRDLSGVTGPDDPRVRVMVQYGMTEAGGGIAMTAEGGDGLVGHLCPGVIAKIVDAEGGEKDTAAIGEIVVRTPFAPDCYWGDPEQSKKVFRDGFVYTGDLGYFRTDGQLFLVGRSKELIIQGGTNIYPAEISRVVARMPGVRDCAVVGCANAVLGEAVAVCIVRESGDTPNVAEVQASCRENLDAAKQPVHVLFLAEIPRTEVGKVNVEVLRREVSTRLAEGRTATTDLHHIPFREAAGIIKEVLDEVLLEAGISAANTDGEEWKVPFGELGLNSLSAVRFAHGLSVRFGIEVPAIISYSCPTIEACARWLGTASTRESATSTLGISRFVSKSAPPVALVGIGLRVPGGVSTPREFWELMWEERETVAEAPISRRTEGRAPWRASFVEDIGDFDAEFFHLRSTAAEIDPRHRQLLEVCWEALEDARIDPTTLDGDRIGAFLGLSGQRHGTLDTLGGSVGMGAGYLCHFFDIRGPVVTLDTTCSSALVALHHAVMSLGRDECDIAIVGGSHVLYEPPIDDRLGVISASGKTRAFDASASGFGQGEGTVIVVLKRDSEAKRVRDRVYAHILGTAINHDGRSASLTAPNPQAQARVISAALQVANLKPDMVQYIEAHGTGTPLGDPVELEGIAKSLGTGRRRPLTVGSVKTNIGHLEAAAGLAGFVKVALSVWHRRLPASRHFSQPNQKIPWDQISVRVQASKGGWPEPNRRLIAGVSAFGMSGTNAHAIVAEVDRLQRTQARPCATNIDKTWLIPISAATHGALRIAVSRWIQTLDEATPPDIENIAYTAGCGRAHLPCRLAVVARTRQELVLRLREKLGGAEKLGNLGQPPIQLALIFTGQGSQWNGMARKLFADNAIFRDSLLCCASLIEAETGWNLLSELNQSDSQSRLDDTEITQPALFAIQTSIWRVLQSWGIVASAAVGHSAGEVAAAHVAGLLTLPESVRLICRRGQVSSRAPPGGMLAVAMSAADGELLCNTLNGDLEVGAVNGPRSIVLTGPLSAIEAALQHMKKHNLGARLLPGRRAFHSRLMSSVAAEMKCTSSFKCARTPELQLISGMTASPAVELDENYWARQLRERVNFLGAMHCLLHRGVGAFIEIGPHPALLSAIGELLRECGRSAEPYVSGSMRREGGGEGALLDCVGRLYCAGVAVDWYKLQGEGIHCDLPRYPWEHRSFGWIENRENVLGPRNTFINTLPKVSEEESRLQTAAEGLKEVLSGLIEQPSRLENGSITLEELGIDSLGRIQVGERLEKRCNRGRLLPTPDWTVAYLLGLLEGSGSVGSREWLDVVTDPSLCWIRMAGKGPLHVWIHPAGGGVECYAPLAALLPYPAMTIDCPNCYPAAGLLNSIEALAAQYVDQLVQQLQCKTVVLGGWSFGGVVAYEMARILRRRKIRVAQVTMIDALAWKVLSRIKRMVVAPNPGGGLGEGSQLRHRVQSLQDHHVELLLRYRPKKYAGRVVSLRAVPYDGEPDEIWRAVAPDLHVTEVDANHFSIISAVCRSPLHRIAISVT
jgi:acyl transferase domain-containing protein/acyl-CoA synthetase (AMP-forming)/AMP-acid ligase II/thioesterase domain-containing protein